MKLSAFGRKFTAEAGITSLMDDLGNALASGDEMIMMGGGNPGHIPEVQERVQYLQQAHQHVILLGCKPHQAFPFTASLADFLPFDGHHLAVAGIQGFVGIDGRGKQPVQQQKQQGSETWCEHQ